MNKIYKVIWNEARKCYVVVAEIAKNRGKNNVRSIVERLAAKSAQAVLEMITATHNSVSVVDTMRRRMEYLPSIPDIAYYDRSGLIQIDEDEEEKSTGGIVVE